MMIVLQGTNGQSVRVNPKYIEFYRRSENHTMIRLVSGSDLYVSETVQQVDDKLQVEAHHAG